MKTFKQYIIEAKFVRPKGTKKIFKPIHADKESFYNAPEMMGHRWAAETLDRIEALLTKYNKTKMQKWLNNEIFGEIITMKSDSDSWHITRRFTNKYIALIQFALRRIDKKDYNHLRNLIANKGAMVKERLDWALEFLAYKYDREAFAEDYSRNIGAFGMKEAEAKKRLAGIMKSIESKIKNRNI